MTIDQIVTALLGSGALGAVAVAVIQKRKPKIDQQALANGAMRVANETLQETLEAQREEMAHIRSDQAAMRSEMAAMAVEVATAKSFGARAVAYIRDLHANWNVYRLRELPPVWVD